MINIAVEGDSDRELARAVVRYTGNDVGTIRPAGGKTKLDPKIPKYCRAAKFDPWVVFRDSDGDCPVELHAKLTESILEWHPQFCLRIAHTMSESWLLADAKGVSEYFKVSENLIPGDPDSLPHAKQELLRLCRKSRSKKIRDDMTADGNRPGPLYVTHINEFASTKWDISRASATSMSLRRAVAAIKRIQAK